MTPGRGCKRGRLGWGLFYCHFVWASAESADQIGGLLETLELAQNRLGEGRSDDEHKTDSHIKNAVHFFLCDGSPLG